MPALIPKPETYIEDLENSKIETKYQKMPDGRVIPMDHFKLIKSGTHLGQDKDEIVLKMFGCKTCRWVNTELCPHKGNGVTHLKPHANKICSQRLTIPKQLHAEGVTMTGKQMLQVKGLMDAEYFSRYVQNAALEGKKDINDCFPWEKLKADILKEMRKQDEGSKIQISNVVDDLRKTLNESKVIEAEVIDKKGGDLNDLRKKEEISSGDLEDD